MKIHPDLRRGIRFLAAFSLMGCLLLPATAQRQRTPNPLRRTDAAFFQTDTARLIGEQVPALKDNIQIFSIGTVIGSHTGPGTVALFFMGDKRVD